MTSSFKSGLRMVWQGMKTAMTSSALGRPLYLYPLDMGGCGGCMMAVRCRGNYPYTKYQDGFLLTQNTEKADAILLSGALSRAMLPTLDDIWREIPEPKGVISIGNCTNSENLFTENYAVLGDVQRLAKVDLFIAGCPPTPQDIVDGIVSLLKKAQDRL